MAERRRIEAALETQKALVEAANRTKDNFLAMLSHELRTPLSPVLLAVENLQNEWPKRPEIAPALEMIRRNIGVEQHLIDDLLDVTRISKGKLTLNLTSVNAHEQRDSANYQQQPADYPAHQITTNYASTSN